MSASLGVDPEAVLAHLPLTDKQADLLHYLRGAPRGDAERHFSARLRNQLVAYGYAEPDENGHLVPTNTGLVAIKVSDDHRWSSHRRHLGGSPVAGGGQRWGLGARCRCRFNFKTNNSGALGRKDLAAQHAQHVRDYFLGEST